MKEQEQLKEQNQYKSNFWGGKGWIGNIVKDLEPKKTPEEYWKEERLKVKEEYLTLFDQAESKTLKKLLVDFSVRHGSGFFMYLADFEDLTEKEFSVIKTITPDITIRSCDPMKLIYSIYRKKELEKYSLNFKPTEKTIKDLYNISDWTIDKYTFTLE